MKKSIKILLLIISILIVCILLVLFLYKKDVKSYNDLDKYEEYLDHLRNNSDARSRLFIFPDKINKDKVESFEYLTQEGLFDGSYLFYIVVNYDEKEYNKEEERIKNIKRIYNGKNKYILKAEDLKYETYITICDGMDTYEYAMLDNDNKKIAYVFRQLFNANNKLDKDYVLNYIVPRENRDKYSPGYNMYYFYDDYGIGYMEGYEQK